MTTAAPLPKWSTPVVTDDIHEGFTRQTSERAAFDLRGTEHAKYGQATRRLSFTLVGPKGAISWGLFTGEYVRDPMMDEMAGAVASHIPDPKGGPCDVVPGGKCRGDIGFLIGDDVLAAYKQGEEAMWQKLHDLYVDWIENETTE